MVTTVSHLAIHARCTDIGQGKGLVIAPTETALVVGTYLSASTPANEAVEALCGLGADLVTAGF